MRILVVGSGASLEESTRIGVPNDLRLPLIGNFARQLWRLDGLPVSIGLVAAMTAFLQSRGRLTDADVVSTFIELEKNTPKEINVEKLFAFAWNRRAEFGEDAWGELVRSAIVNQLIELIIRGGFFENGVGWKALTANQTVNRKLQPKDFVVSLNYETLFEMAADQLGNDYVYAPHEASENQYTIVKPHGSVNLIVEKDKFWFAQSEIIGTLLVPGESGWHLRGIVPPREGKDYDQHPIGKIILDSVRTKAPDILTFWGVGFTFSDIDLTEVYKQWATTASRIEIIHPDENAPVLEDAKSLFGREVNYYSSPETWLKMAPEGQEAEA